MGNASTKERSLTPPHGGHHHHSSTNLSSRRNNGGNNGGPSSSSGRLSGTLLASGGAGNSENYSGRGRSRHNIESSLFGLGLGSSRETRERDREAEREAKEQRKAEREKERLRERERSLREESVDGGYLLILCCASAVLCGNAGEGENGLMLSNAIRRFLGHPGSLHWC